MEDVSADWLRQQQAFLEQWLGVDAGFAADPWQKLKTLFADPGAAANPAHAPPWQAYSAFADLLRAQSENLKTGRRRRVDVGAAMQALLETLVRGIDTALAAQVLARREDGSGALAFGQAFVAWPALGLGREWQLRLQRCWLAWLADREADDTLRTLQWRALRAGCERCRQSLTASGPAITSLRGLHGLFVDALELAWREAAMGDDYARAFGARVNAGLRLRLALRDCVQALASPLELAGRAELDALERRLRALEERAPTLAADTAPSATVEPRAVAPVVDATQAGTPTPSPAAPASKRRSVRRPPAAPRAAAEAPGQPAKSTTPAARRAPRRKPAARRPDFDISSVIAGHDDKGD
jgi:hypothetical protein